MLEPEATRQHEQAVLNNTESTPNIIYIYNDEGAGENSVKYILNTLAKIATTYKINFINAQDILAKEWVKNAALLVMPGGADIPYTEKLNGEGNKIIKKYVESGGSYLGFCAGAYYGSNFVEFDKNGELEVLGERELAFFPDKSVGPILAKYDYKTNSGARAALLKLNMPDDNDFTNISVYYNGGGYFYNADSYKDVNVLAYYHIEKDNNYLPAIVEIKCNKGIAILSGVHFECSSKLLDINDPYESKLLPILEKEEENRVKFSISIFKRLGVRVNS